MKITHFMKLKMKMTWLIFFFFFFGDYIVKNRKIREYIYIIYKIKNMLQKGFFIFKNIIYCEKGIPTPMQPAKETELSAARPASEE